MRLIGSSLGRRFGLGGAVLIAVMAVIGVLALGASAKSGSDDVLHLAKAEHVGTKTEPIAVDQNGKAVYELLPETTTNLLCTKVCLKFWPPVTVAKGTDLSAATGIKGKLATFKRGSELQVTLNGHPLYTFALDKKKGTAKGDGIMNFGGTWHVFKEGKATVSMSPPATGTTTTPTAPAPSPAPPGYPAY
jgi:predicted lipoprotein with Yx(FWY)xxD motif